MLGNVGSKEITTRNNWRQCMKTLIEKIKELFSGKTGTGIDRINKVVSHFQDMLDDLETGSTEIKLDISDNQATVRQLQDEIADIKADNTILGSELGRATSMQRAISAIVNTDKEN